MAEQEVVAVQNAPPPTGQEEVPVPEAEVAPREKNPREDIPRDVINIPSQPALNYEAAGPSNLNANNDMPVDDLLNSRHPREMLPLFQANVPRGGPRFNQRDHKPAFFVVDRPSPYELPRTFVSLRFWTQIKPYSMPKCC